MKKRVFSILLSAVLLISSLAVTGYADTTAGYKEIYMNFAHNADTSYNEITSGVSGLIMMDMNEDSVPELLAYSESTLYIDENGNTVSGGQAGNDQVYEMKEYYLEYAFSIIDGVIVDGTPREFPMSLPCLPEEVMEDSETYCDIVKHENDRGVALMAFDYENYTILQYGEGGFNLLRVPVTEDNAYDVYLEESGWYFVDAPMASISFYDDEKGQKRTRTEAMQLLLGKYEASAANPGGFTASGWALGEVNEANALGLIPEEMLSDDLTEGATRAEFAAIAVNLNRAIEKTEPHWHGGYITDIEGHIYEMYILEAYNYGITNGTGVAEDGGAIFEPEAYINREQMATMLCRVIKRNKFADWDYGRNPNCVLDISNAKKFADDEQISDFAYESVYYMSKHGIIKGMDDMFFGPWGTATKEQAILLSLRIYESFDSLPV